MTDSAFIFALILGAVIIVGMIWVANAASYRLSLRQRYRKAYARPGGPEFDEEPEPELDLGAPTIREPAREAAGRIREIAR